MGAKRLLAARFEVSQPFGGDAAILSVDHLLVALYQVGWHDRCSAMMASATGDVGDLTAERGAVDRVREMVSGLADRQLGLWRAHSAIIANHARFAKPVSSQFLSGRLQSAACNQPLSLYVRDQQVKGPPN
jgi:hypothetical protein